MTLLFLLIVSTVHHMPGDIWIGWKGGFEHHEVYIAPDTILIANHSGIDIGNTHQYEFYPEEIVTISARKRTPWWHSVDSTNDHVGLDSAYYWYNAWTSNGSGQNRLDIYDISGYPGHYYHPQEIVDWAYAQLGKVYNINFYNWDQDSSFYCHQLCYRAFKVVAGIILEDGEYFPPPPASGVMKGALDLAHSWQSRRRVKDYNFRLKGSPPGGGGHEPPIEGKSFQTGLVNLLSELEARYDDIPLTDRDGFERAVYALFQATDNRLWDGVHPDYAQILEYLKDARSEIQDIGILPEIQAGVNNMVNTIQMVMARSQDSKTKGVYIVPEGNNVKLESSLWRKGGKIQITLSSTGNFQYSLVDLMGRTLIQGRLLNIPQGNNTIYVPVDNLPSGRYTLIMRLNGKEYIKGITVIR